MKVLLVEDQPMNADMLSRRLARRGYVVVVAGDGSMAVTMARSEMPDLVLMDIGLPVMDGYEAMEHIRATPETATLPIIALTAHATTEDRDRCFAAGANDFDTKPVEFERLLGKMEEQLRKAGKPLPVAKARR